MESSPLRSTHQFSSPIPLPLPPPLPAPEHVMSSVVVVSRSIGAAPAPVVAMSKVDPEEDGGGGEGRAAPSRTVSAILWRQRREAMVKRAALGFRVCEIVLCLISFSTMAADKTRGWAGDSFDRYKEYKFCLSVAVIAFVYAGFQGYDMAVHLVTGKHIIQHHHRYYFDFAMDQIFTYLLLSSSTASATRSNIWVSNWGKDKFTEMANASAAMSFLAFAAFAVSSLISGYYLCTHSYN
ncbi:hypothetical protein Sjap_016079 [Stephania japonica]|uniref:CASP-like protein n=1 Tax=Stephania japonica TaxID=461633 RepID=A0AAP0IKL1_9MAGN